MSTIATLMAKLGLDASEYDRGARRVTQSAQGLGASLNSALSTAAGFAMANVGMAVIGKAMDAVSGGVIGMNANLQKSTLQFETLMGNADQAKAHVQMLFDFAKETPFETQPIIDASRMLQTFGGAALNTKANLYLVGDAAAATNAPIQELGFWVGRAYSSIAAGRPFGEAAMRLQELAVLSPQARNEMERLQESGASASKVWAVMEKDLARFEGAMKRQAGTWEGLTSTFSDTLGILSSRAFKPFFEMASGGLARLNEWLGREEVTRWADRVAAGLQIAIRGFASLASSVGSSLGAVLRIVQVVGQAIYQALQWINPFARHSPSLVEQVEAGVEAIGKAYASMPPLIAADLRQTEAAVRSFEDAVSSGAGRVAEHSRAEMEKLLEAMGGGAAAAWRDASDAVAVLEQDLAEMGDRVDEAEAALRAAERGLKVFEDAAKASKDRVADLEDQLASAERALRNFTSAPLEGTRAFSDQLFHLENEAKKVQLQLTEMKIAGKPEKELEPLEKQLERLRLEAEKVRLTESLQLDPLRRHLDQIGDMSKEITYKDAVAGALAARQQIEQLTPAVTAAKAQQEAAEGAARRQKELVDAQREGLGDVKERYDELRRAVEGYRQSIEDVVTAARELESIQKAEQKAGGGGAAGVEVAAMSAGAPSPLAGIEEGAKQIEAWVESANATVANFEQNLFLVQVKVGEVAHAFELLFDPERRQIGLDYFAGMFEGIRSQVEGALPGIVARLGEWAGAFLGWVGPMIPQAMARYNEIKLGILNWIAETAPGLGDRLADWAGTFVGWIGPMVPPMIAELGRGLQTMLEWILVNVPVLAAKLGEWGNRLIAWIIEAAPPMLEEAGRLLDGLLGWITENAPRLIDTVYGEWLPALLNWVVTAAETIVPKLLSLLTTIMNWVIDRAPVLAETYFSEWLPAAIGWVAQAAIDILPRLVVLLGTILDWIVLEGVPKLFEFATKMGGAILGGMGKGLERLGAKLDEWVLGAIHSIHIDLGWIVIDGRSGVSFNIPTPPVPSLGSGGGGEHEPGGATYEAWVAAGSPDYNALQGYASGGIAWEPQVARVAEREPEAIIPLRDLPTLVPAMAALGAGGGGRLAEDRLQVRVFLGEREFEDVWVETGTAAQRRGRWPR